MLNLVSVLIISVSLMQLGGWSLHKKGVRHNFHLRTVGRDASRVERFE